MRGLLLQFRGFNFEPGFPQNFIDTGQLFRCLRLFRGRRKGRLLDLAATPEQGGIFAGSNRGKVNDLAGRGLAAFLVGFQITNTGGLYCPLREGLEAFQPLK